MEKQDKKRVKRLSVVAGATVLLLLGFASVPCFCEADGNIMFYTQAEINAAEEADDSGLDQESIRMAQARNIGKRKSLFSILLDNENGMEPGNDPIQNNPETIPDENTGVQHIERDKDPETKQELTASTSNMYGTTDPKESHDQQNANGWLTKDRGRSDEFFSNQEGKPVILDFGQGAFDVSEYVEYWMFGEPVFDLNRLSKLMGLKLSVKQPEDFIDPPRYETYYPGDDPEMNQDTLFDIYLISPQGDSIQYKSGSTIQIDNHGYVYINTFQVAGDRSEGYKTLVSLSELPYYDGNRMQAGVPVRYKYEDTQIVLTYGDPEKHSGHLAIESVTIAEEEPDKKTAEASGSNIDTN